MRRVLTIGAFGSDDDITRLVLDKPKPESVLTWPSGVTSIDKRAGGFYGSTLIGGRQKIGKSMMALRSSLLAAEEGWSVAYFDGENDPDELARRAWNGFGPELNMDLWQLMQFSRPVTLERIADEAAKTCEAEDSKFLVVIDSLNRLAKHMTRNDKRYSKGNGYFRALEDICQWAQSCAMLSGGHIGVMMTAEQNRAGLIVGMDPEYTCQCIVYIRPSKVEGNVELDLISRRTRGGDLGEHVRRFDRCEFVECGVEEENLQPEWALQ